MVVSACPQAGGSRKKVNAKWRIQETIRQKINDVVGWKTVAERAGESGQEAGSIIAIGVSGATLNP